MKKFIVYYRDPVGRKNQCEVFAKDSIDAESKFRVLYADCVITDTI